MVVLSTRDDYDPRTARHHARLDIMDTVKVLSTVMVVYINKYYLENPSPLHKPL